MRGARRNGLQVCCRLFALSLSLAVAHVHTSTDDVSFRLPRRTPNALVSMKTSDIWQKVTEQLLYGWPRHMLADDGLLWQRSVRRRHSYDDVTSGEVQTNADDAILNSSVVGDEQSEDHVTLRADDVHRKQTRTDRVEMGDDVDILNKRTGIMGLDNIDYATTLLDSQRRQHQEIKMKQRQQPAELSRHTVDRLTSVAQGYVDGLYGLPSSFVLQLERDRGRDLDRSRDDMGLPAAQRHLSRGPSTGYPRGHTSTATPRPSSPAMKSNSQSFTSSTALRMGKSTPQRHQQRVRSHLPSLNVSPEDIRSMMRMMSAG